MLKVRIETKNSAFEGDLKGEVIRCLNSVIENITRPSYAGGHIIEGPIHDTNGNPVGSFKLTNR